MKLLLVWICVTVAAAMLTAAASSQQSSPARVALLIGNADYRAASPPLSTTIRDVRALAAELARNDFTVDVRENVDKNQMERAMDAFLSPSRPNGDRG